MRHILVRSGNKCNLQCLEVKRIRPCWTEPAPDAESATLTSGCFRRLIKLSSQSTVCRHRTHESRTFVSCRTMLCLQSARQFLEAPTMAASCEQEQHFLDCKSHLVAHKRNDNNALVPEPRKNHDFWSCGAGAGAVVSGWFLRVVASESHLHVVNTFVNVRSMRI